MEALGGAVAILWLFLFVLFILWIILPFAIFGTKPLLKALREEIEIGNRQRGALLAAIQQLDRTMQRTERRLMRSRGELPDDT